MAVVGLSGHLRRIEAKRRTMEDEMRAVMGFSSFGRPRKRARRHEHSAKRSCDADSHTRTSYSAATEHEVHHVVPGTAVEPTDGDALASCMRVSSNGVTVLVKHEGNDTEELSKIFAVDDGNDGCCEALAEGATKQSMWSLPASSMELLAQLEATKASFEELNRKAFATARRVANPYEALGRQRFINRSAMKMANLDFLFQWTESHKRATQTEPFVFADVCGGPGGFSEYFLWRMQQSHSHKTVLTDTKESEKQLNAVGFGISLRGTDSCDWKVGVAETEARKTGRSAFHVCDGDDGTGDLYKLANIHAFKEAVRRKIPTGAHLVVADGGFPDVRDHHNQEYLMTRLVVAEILTMFHVLRAGGSFVLKTFELSSPLSLQLVWILYQCFEEFSIVKPVTSRPASSERYVVARQLHSDLPTARITTRLEELLTSFESSHVDNAFVFNWSVSPTRSFQEYMRCSSDRIAHQQLCACTEIINIAREAPTKQRLRSLNVDDYYQSWRLYESGSE